MAKHIKDSVQDAPQFIEEKILSPKIKS